MNNIIKKAGLDQAKFQMLFTEEIKKIEMPWTSNLKEWYPYAQKALAYFNCLEMGFPQERFGDLLKSSETGVNAWIVAFLSNNLQKRTAFELELEDDLVKFSEILKLNFLISYAWKNLTKQTEEAIKLRMSLQANTPSLQIAH